MDACAEVANIIRQHGSLYLSHGNLDLAMEYYSQAAATMGGGEVSCTGQGNADQQRQRSLMLKQLLTEILLRDCGTSLLLGPRGSGDEGALRKYLMDFRSQQQFLLEVAHQCQETGLYNKVDITAGQEEATACMILEEIALKVHQLVGVRMHRLAVCECEVKALVGVSWPS